MSPVRRRRSVVPTVTVHRTATAAHTPSRQPAAPTVVVVGGSIAGLLAAAAVRPHAARVVICERDRLPATAASRPGTPQANHAHGLLASGRLAMETLVPGLTAALLDAGAISRGDLGSNGRWWIGGQLVTDCEVGQNGVAASRPLIEATLRDRVLSQPGIELREYVEVLGLTLDPDRRQVTGVRLQSRTARTAPEVLAADLVVDASGRAARAGGWLEEHGYPAPAEERVDLGVRYATTHVEARPDDLDGRAVAISAATPQVPRGGAAILQEGGRWVVMVSGYTNQQPPLDPDGLRAYARTLVSPDLAALLSDRDLLEAPRAFRFAACRRRRFEQLTDLPGGYVAIGDAIASFDPTFGQGMSVAALQAVALREEVASGLTGLGRRFHRRAARIAAGAWDVVVGAVVQLDGVEGPTPPGHAVIARYVRAVQRTAATDPLVARALLRVTNLLEPPTSLMRPRIAVRVLVRRSRAASTRPATAEIPADHLEAVS
jgi:2-polyprenyl-6-methoxyphenol hydroxylase-like FAD-dependent oxidoreductase